MIRIFTGLFFTVALHCGVSFTPIKAQMLRPGMMFGDSTHRKPAFAKDPHVVWFGKRYLLYYSVPTGKDSTGADHWGIGIAESHDLLTWRKVAEIPPVADYERKGFCAPGALVRDGIVHLFYQTYGNGRNDAICHASSTCPEPIKVSQ